MKISQSKELKRIEDFKESAGTQSIMRLVKKSSNSSFFHRLTQKASFIVLSPSER
jgi:hypothetical protein